MKIIVLFFNVIVCRQMVSNNKVNVVNNCFTNFFLGLLQEKRYEAGVRHSL